jgi:hypothetical protein
MLTYFLTSFYLTPWAIKIDKIRIFYGEEMKRQREGTVWLTGRRFALQKKIEALE